MFTLVVLYTLYTPIYVVYPFLPSKYCIPCIPLYILCTHEYPSNTVYLVYPYILCTHVYPSNTVYPVYPYVPCISGWKSTLLKLLRTLKVVRFRDFTLPSLPRPCALRKFRESSANRLTFISGFSFQGHPKTI